MKKSVTTSFVCQECGYESPKFLGRCPECGAWASLKEISIRQLADKNDQEERLAPKTLAQIEISDKKRVKTTFSEFDSVLGGGIVPGSVIILAGDPGIGKSTLLLQLGLSLASLNQNILYVSGEESEKQVKLRANRLLENKKSTSFRNFFLVSSNNTDSIVSLIADSKPNLVIIDSIQTMESGNAGGLSGSIPQVRYASASFIRLAKTLGIPIILVGHVTKEGMVAGPMTLSHMVDTVLFLEGDRGLNTRILRSFKNRFGPIDEVGIFAMEENGITQVRDPENLFFEQRAAAVAGSVVVAVVEGTRAFLVEIQALVVFSKLPIPRRVAAGVDSRRLELLLAVLQKHAGLPLSGMDVFVNVAGGLRITDPASDLGICLALVSSLKNKAFPKTVAIAEVGLLGELRQVPLLDKRVKEAKKLGFQKILSIKSHKFLNQVIKGLS